MSTRLSLLTALLVMLAATVASACVVIPRPPPRPDVQPLYLQCKSQHVETTINDQVARTTVTTLLHNPHDRPVEGTFLFPLPANASVSNFSYWIGDKEMKGEVLDRDQARKIYEDIVRTMRDPALLEYDGSGLFKASIFPIPGGGDAKTKLEFTQVLKAENGVVRYAHAVKLGRSNPNVGQLVVDVNIRSQVPIKSVYSPTHKIDVTRKGDNNVSAGMELDNTDFSQDFELYYTLANKDFGVSVLTHRPEGEDGCFMLLLAPKQDWGAGEIENKDVIFALDTSGSMMGEKLEQAKKAFDYCLGALKPHDRFGLLTFSTETRHFEDKLLEATPANIKRARDFVGKTESAGSTTLNEALVEAVELVGKRGDRPAMVIFLTDGLQTVGERDNAKIVANVSKANKTGADDETSARLGRMFIFGVGDDVNTHLLDELADRNGGSTNYVRPTEDIEASVSSLYSKMSHPVLSDVKVKIADVQAHDIYPQKLPDLFVGNQVVLAGRYDGSGGAAITLTGTAAGKEKSYTYEGTFPTETAGNAFLARVWATRRIGYLLDQIRLRGETDETKKEVVTLALKFGIVTPYTSALVQEDKVMTANAAVQQRAFGLAAGGPGRAGDALNAGLAAPAAPRAAMKSQTGGGAVNAAQSLQRMKDGEQVQGQFQSYQLAGGRTFFLNGEQWVDTKWQVPQKVLKIKAFSDAYFDLLRVRPDLAAALAVGSQVQVQMTTLGLEIGPEGLETLTPDQLEELKK
ncbi:MAG: VIT domain-containing protein [Armatimonadota bacterium]